MEDDAFFRAARQKSVLKHQKNQVEKENIRKKNAAQTSTMPGHYNAAREMPQYC